MTMDLIIKPTQACNFACSFCSSNNISRINNTLKLEKIYDILLNNDVRTIIINGGDPLMMSPRYYFDIIKFLDEHNMKTCLSFTTNLWDFYLNPDKWIELFNNEHVRICTSFQYGTGRKLKDGTIYSEELFRKVMEKYRSIFNKVPMFISVITKENENEVIKTVELAKDLNTICKINPAFKSGRSSEYYPFYKAYEKYLDIIETGLEEYEFNAKEIKRLFHNQRTCCPYNRRCYETIRCLNPDGVIHSCGAFNDDYYVNLSKKQKTYNLELYDEKELFNDYKSLKNDCFACELFMFCNSCYKRIADIKENNDIEENCAMMKKLYPRMVKLLS